MRRARGHKLQRADADAAQRIGPQVRLLAQGQRRIEQLARQIRRVPQRHAVTAPVQVGRAHAQLYRAALVPLQPQARAHAFRQRQERCTRVRLTDEVARRSGAVADGFRRRQILDAVHRRGVIPVGVGVQQPPSLAKALLEHVGVRRRERTDRADAQPLELPHRAASGEEQAADRQRPDHVRKVRAVNDRHGVRLAVVRAELRDRLAPRHADAHRQARGVEHALAHLLRRLQCVLAADTAGHVQPALIHAERLAPVGEAGIDLAHAARVVVVEVEVRRQDRQLRALLPRRPECHARAHPGGARHLVLGQDDAVAQLPLPADRHRPPAQLRMAQQLDARIAGVDIRM